MFALNNETVIDVVLCVAMRDCLFVRKTIRMIHRNLPVRTIYLITKRSCFLFFPEQCRKACHLTLVDEDALLPGLTFSGVRKILKKQGNERNTGWYFQQFLKMGFALSRYAGERYLIWDADTLPTSPLCFEDGGQLCFAAKTEHHKPYFNTTQRLFGLGKSVDYSFIAEHMVIITSVMKELIAEIEKAPVEGKVWVEKIMNAVDRDATNAFSEFETYGTYVVNKYPGRYKTRVLKTWREAGKRYGRGITDGEIRSLDGVYDTISVETRDVPPFPRCLQHYAIKIAVRSICNILSFVNKS